MKIIVLILIFLLGVVGLNTNRIFAAANPPKVYVDGKLISASNKPIVRDKVIYVPVQEIAPKLGLKVTCNGSLSKITFKHPYRSIDATHKVGTNKVMVGNSYMKLRNKSFKIKGIVYVPLELFKAFDANVFWEPAKNSIYISTYELKQLQALAFADLAYDNIELLPEGKQLKNVNLNKMPKINITLEGVRNNLGIYTNEKGDALTANTFFKKYLRLSDWEVATYLRPSDFSSTAKYNKMIKSGFEGYVFRNRKTNEFMIAFRGTEFTWESGDIRTNLGIGLLRSNNQKKYAFKLFQKVVRKYDKPTIYLTGHSLGGNLVEDTASHFPDEYKQAYTYNATGTNKKALTTKVINSRIYTDPVSSFYSHYGRTSVFYVRPPSNILDPMGFASHRLFNFYGYYFLPGSKYWGQDIPYTYGLPTYLWAYKD
ncbi:stalk domain-containing protein [Priestia aryabhattai]|uniref:Stalk domain-containing protein n=1 Tax=Priestia aryabhattai TaxID=412384 RepID=A0AAX6NDE7_PRIAR|nr:stalk domain-containing protein [Priestia aryabhattai]MDU9693918.1 stalk domain-containing protein [Priestia aryabhattai]